MGFESEDDPGGHLLDVVTKPCSLEWGLKVGFAPQLDLISYVTNSRALELGLKEKSNFWNNFTHRDKPSCAGMGFETA